MSFLVSNKVPTETTLAHALARESVEKLGPRGHNYLVYNKNTGWKVEHLTLFGRIWNTIKSLMGLENKITFSTQIAKIKGDDLQGKIGIKDFTDDLVVGKLQRIIGIILPACSNANTKSKLQQVNTLLSAAKTRIQFENALKDHLNTYNYSDATITSERIKDSGGTSENGVVTERLQLTIDLGSWGKHDKIVVSLPYKVESIENPQINLPTAEDFKKPITLALLDKTAGFNQFTDGFDSQPISFSSQEAINFWNDAQKQANAFIEKLDHQYRSLGFFAGDHTYSIADKDSAAGSQNLISNAPIPFCHPQLYDDHVDSGRILPKETMENLLIDIYDKVTSRQSEIYPPLRGVLEDYLTKNGYPATVQIENLTDPEEGKKGINSLTLQITIQPEDKSDDIILTWPFSVGAFGTRGFPSQEEIKRKILEAMKKS